MTPKETIQRYFDRLQQKQGWDALLADDMTFTSFTSPLKHVTGRAAYLETTKRFYSMIVAVEVRDLTVQDDKVCALTHYALQPPNGGAAFTSDVAEIFSVTNDKIASLAIYFDATPFPSAPRNEALAVARDYHRAWTGRDFAAAAALLASNLQVEVPINEYPTRESFAAAVAGFGATVKRVDLLAEFAQGPEAMLLYDMDVERLGPMRVAEHFTVSAGKITRIRQIHDTAAIRAAGELMPG